MNVMKKINGMFIGDPHIDDLQPKNRKDSYEDATVLKMTECLQYAEKHKLDYVCILGDLFDRYEVGPKLRNRMIDLFKGSANDDTPWSFPIYIVVGNHDIDATGNLNKTTLGTLIQSNLLIKKDYEPEFGIQFGHFHRTIDEEAQEGYFAKYPAMIWAAHSSMSTKPDPFNRDVYLFENTPLHDNTKMIICGHLHGDMEQTRADGKIFINPGATGRRSANDSNFKKKIKILILSYTLDGDIYEKKYYYLKSAKPSEEVFKMNEIAVAKQAKSYSQQTKERIASIRIESWAFTNLQDKVKALEHACKEASLSDKVWEIVKRNITEINEKEGTK